MTTKQEKLTKYTERAEKLRAELAHTEAMEGNDMYRRLNRAHGQLEKVANSFSAPEIGMLRDALTILSSAQAVILLSYLRAAEEK